jgi:hypothetical protein
MGDCQVKNGGGLSQPLRSCISVGPMTLNPHNSEGMDAAPIHGNEMEAAAAIELLGNSFTALEKYGACRISDSIH